MKKLGIAYNLFDGEELLANSLENMRSMVDFICVVYQTKSNFNNLNKNVEKVVKDLKSKGLIDYIYKYEANYNYDKNSNIHLTNGLNNEITKRNIGLEICKQNNCDIFMTIDCDEFYDEKQFYNCRKEFEENDYDSSFCKMKTFYKHPTYELKKSEDYYVPLFYKIKNNNKFNLSNRDSSYPVIADPTRTLKAGYSRVFARDEIEMYHYSYVRSSIISKIVNSSSQSDYETKSEIISHFDKFKNIKQGALIVGNYEIQELKKVDNKFNIEI